eukprot:5761098-Amphidinium_carterae.2
MSLSCCGLEQVEADGSHCAPKHKLRATPTSQKGAFAAVTSHEYILESPSGRRQIESGIRLALKDHEKKQQTAERGTLLSELKGHPTEPLTK